MFLSLLLTFIGGAACVGIIMLVIVGVQHHRQKNKTKED
ncbi:hypothetical protein JOC59_001393 [Weissella beninensis]|nr:hypothetical protein [Periweissella beninensis]